MFLLKPFSVPLLLAYQKEEVGLGNSDQLHHHKIQSSLSRLSPLLIILTSLNIPSLTNEILFGKRKKKKENPP